MKPFFKQSGFTLLEVLVAMAIFAIIGLGTATLMTSVMRTDERIVEHSERLGEVQKAFWILSNDLDHVANRQIRDTFGEFKPALSTEEEDYFIEFSKLGWRNPLQQKRSNLQRVAYVLGDHPDPDVEDELQHLVRLYWSTLDRAPDSEPKQQLLLSNVEEVEIRFFSGGSWYDDWPADDINTQPDNNNQQKNDQGMLEKTHLPQAIELKLTVPPYGELRRVFQVRE